MPHANPTPSRESNSSTFLSMSMSEQETQLTTQHACSSSDTLAELPYLRVLITLSRRMITLACMKLETSTACLILIALLLSRNHVSSLRFNRVTPNRYKMTALFIAQPHQTHSSLCTPLQARHMPAHQGESHTADMPITTTSSMTTHIIMGDHCCCGVSSLMAVTIETTADDVCTRVSAAG